MYVVSSAIEYYYQVLVGNKEQGVSTLFEIWYTYANYVKYCILWKIAWNVRLENNFKWNFLKWPEYLVIMKQIEHLTK